ncbi:DUF3196 domain-containing protein [Filibacter tadaridae]|uniref:Uncharacterized protein n=1 Tax=Filibacter tadaridae TaxID=2483811 RepID=A0A3P5XCU4_9BACL|nr:DUF3196 family protein [Filibacter tadaridae]VDC32671.1 hypothetical protein FILTAD_02855 [Filibacter tadaridae]
MRRKYGRLRKKENIVVFPGTFEKLVETGHTFVDQEEYEKAVKAFDQAIQYEPDYPDFLGPYAVSLYEIKEFERAKEIAARLLHTGTTDYIDAMELYLTISIQLQEYEEVEMTIGAIMDEGIVPEDMMKKFNYLRELNTRLSERYMENAFETPAIVFTVDEFIAMDTLSQQYALASLEGSDLSSIAPVMHQIIELSELSPLVITFALTLLHQTAYSEEVTVSKFGGKKTIIPAEMTLPGQDVMTADVLVAVEEQLQKDPSRLDMVRGLIEKFAITAFPFDWGDYTPEDVATAYIQYIESLFSGEDLPVTNLISLIRRIDNESDFSDE